MGASNELVRKCVACAALLLGLARSDTVASLELGLPIDPADAGSAFLLVAGFGYHVAEHRLDGHPGVDFEYKPGTKIKAAIGGTLNYFVNSHDSSKYTVQVDFSADGKSWRNVYTNLSAIEPGLAKGATVTTGQILGTAGSVNFVSGTTTITYAMTHFQLDDMSGTVSYGLSNTSAISPLPYFSTAAKSAFETLASRATYSQQLCEPFMSTPRGLLPYPALTRRWSRTSGALAPRIDFTCDHAAASSTYRYVLYESDGAVRESGTAALASGWSPTPAIDLTAANGSRRLGIFAIDGVRGTLTINTAAPGSARPTSFDGASVYTTGTAATACAAITDAVCLSGEASPYRSDDRLDLNLAVFGERIAAGAGAVDVWAAVATPGGALLYFTPVGVSANAAALRSALTLAASGPTLLPLVESVPASALGAGRYTLYALIAPAGTPAAQVVEKKQGNLMTVTVAIQP